jgi:DNA-binding MarR family transcriptional regulator
VGHHDPKLQAWFTFLQAERVSADALDHDLRSATGLTMLEHEVLLHLEAAPRHRLATATLAAELEVGPQTASRVVERLVAGGLVERSPDPDRPRGSLLTLTEEGAHRLRAAECVHLAGVRTHFLDLLTQREARELRSALRKVLAANGRREQLL